MIAYHVPYTVIEGSSACENLDKTAPEDPSQFHFMVLKSLTYKFTTSLGRQTPKLHTGVPRVSKTLDRVESGVMGGTVPC